MAQHMTIQQSLARISAKGNAELRQLAEDYVRKAGIRDSIPTTRYLCNDPDAQRATARYYEFVRSAPDWAGVRSSYDELIAGVLDQFMVLLDAGYSFDPFDDEVPDPYLEASRKNGTSPSEEMRRDLRENKHLWVYAGGEDHPYLCRGENWVFRAVHDCFGHAANGYDFGPRGELNAAIEHAKMFRRGALYTLFAETHAQNSFVNFGPFSDRPVADRPFANQKAVLIPSRYWPTLEFEVA